MTLSNLLSSTPEGRRALAAAKLRGDVLEMLHDALAEVDMSRVALANRLGRSKSAVTNALTGDGNLRITTIAEYLDAMDMEMCISARPRGTASEVRRHRGANYPTPCMAQKESFWSDMPFPVGSSNPAPLERHQQTVRKADYAVAA